MQDKIAEIQKIAGELQQLNEDKNHLFEQINQLDKSSIEQLLSEYEHAKSDYKPVNLLRYEILQGLRKGDRINEAYVESVKNKIRNKDTVYFSHYGDQITEALKNYPKRTKDIFTNWKNPFRIFYTFFYPAAKRNNVTQMLYQIGDDVLKELKVNDFKIHVVDFKGAQNFGDTRCWIALFPAKKVSHKKAYQFLLTIDTQKIEAGMKAGFDLKKHEPDDLKPDVSSYNDAVEKLHTVKNKVLYNNKILINYWKYAPGEQAKFWNDMYNEGIMAIRWDDVSNLEKLTDEDICDILNIDEPDNSNTLWNLKNFRDASIGDIVIANKGKHRAVGIGIIRGKYEYHSNKNTFKHVRKVEWIINEEVDFGKTMFRPDTFSPTLKWEEIKNRYSKISIDYRDKLQQIIKGKTEISFHKEDPNDTEDRSYWWLNANPKIWSIDGFKENETQDYTTHNKLGNKRRIYKYFTEVKPGDLVVGYESSPSKQVKGIFEIREGLHEEKKQEKITFEMKEKVDEPISWDDLKDNPELQQCEVLINNQGSLFKLSKDEYEIIRDLIDEKRIIAEYEDDSIEKPPYKYKDDPDKPFIPYSYIQKIENALELKKNIVLQGPPGTGKTFVARKLAYDIMGKKDDSKIEMIQFHQSYSYEDFIQGIRPDKDEFRVKNGVFYNFCKKAGRDYSNDYFFIIDEINRGNLSKIFGELMMLIESDKRGEKYSIPLTYSENQDERFYVPENVHIIGTMNTADRSLAIVDYALRRRFDFITIEPQFNDSFLDFLLAKGIKQEQAKQVIDLFNGLNKRISNDKNLGQGFQIGHSYFCNNEIDGNNYRERYSHIIEFEIVPLLEEYWFDSIDKVQAEKDNLLNI
mgnify:CR=1 FL=1